MEGMGIWAAVVLLGFWREQKRQGANHVGGRPEEDEATSNALGCRSHIRRLGLTRPTETEAQRRPFVRDTAQEAAQKRASSRVGSGNRTVGARRREGRWPPAVPGVEVEVCVDGDGLHHAGGWAATTCRVMEEGNGKKKSLRRSLRGVQSRRLDC